MDTPRPQTISRRTFIKLMGAASAATTGTLLMSGGLGAPGLVKDFFSGNDFKIGVLLPTSKSHAQMGANLLAGMESYFGLASTFNPQFVTEEVPFGYGEVAAKATRLVEQERVDIVVAGVSSKVAPRLRDVFDAVEVPFIISNAGASPISPAHLGDFGLHNSLGLWQSSWATGKWAARNAGKGGVMVTTLADSGYASAYSFQLGLESAGGHLFETHFADLPRGDGQRSVVDQIAAANPDFVYALLSGKAASQFLEEYDRRRLPPLIASSFMAESFALPHATAPAGLPSVGTWAESLDTPENAAFFDAYRSYAGRDPDPYSLLGFETAHMIAESAMALDGRMGNGGRVLRSLSKANITGPRGQVSVDSASRSITPNLFLRETRAYGRSWRNRAIEELPRVSLADARDAGIMAASKSGLLNEYLCSV